MLLLVVVVGGFIFYPQITELRDATNELNDKMLVLKTAENDLMEKSHRAALDDIERKVEECEKTKRKEAERSTDDIEKLRNDLEEKVANLEELVEYAPVWMAMMLGDIRKEVKKLDSVGAEEVPSQLLHINEVIDEVQEGARRVLRESRTTRIWRAMGVGNQQPEEAY